MNNASSFDDSNEFAFIHVRPGEDGKSHPIGTIAIELTPVDDYSRSIDTHRVGFAAQHVKKDPWIAARGRSVAAGRASRSKDPVLVAAPKNASRRELILRSVEAVFDAANEGKINVSKQFRQALADTMNRLEQAEIAARASRSSAAQ